MHSVCCRSLPIWRRSSLKKGTPRVLFWPRPGSAQGRSGRNTTTLERNHECATWNLSHATRKTPVYTARLVIYITESYVYIRNHSVYTGLKENKRSKYIYIAHLITISKWFSPKKDNQNGRIPINAVSKTSVTFCDHLVLREGGLFKRGSF